MSKTLVVLAAGMGSRYGGLKQLDTFGPSGESILEYSVYDAKRAGFTDVVFVIRRDFSEEFQGKIGSKMNGEINVHYAFQDMNLYVPDGIAYEKREKPWGTGHAILVAKPFVDGPFAVINADDRYGQDGYELMSVFLDTVISKSVFGMIGYTLEKTLSPFGSVNRGICSLSENGLLTTVKEHTGILLDKEMGVLKDDKGVILDNNAIASMNFWGFHNSFFTYLQNEFEQFCNLIVGSEGFSKIEFYIPFVCDKAIREQKMSCNVAQSKDLWCGVTYQEDKPFVRGLIEGSVKKGTHPKKLWK